MSYSLAFWKPHCTSQLIHVFLSICPSAGVSRPPVNYPFPRFEVLSVPRQARIEMQRPRDFCAEERQNPMSLRVLLGIFPCSPLKDISHQLRLPAKKQAGYSTCVSPTEAAARQSTPIPGGPKLHGPPVQHCLSGRSPHNWRGLKADSLLLETTMISPTRDGAATAGPRLCFFPDTVLAVGPPHCSSLGTSTVTKPKGLCLQRPAFLPRTFRSSQHLSPLGSSQHYPTYTSLCEAPRSDCWETKQQRSPGSASA